MVGRLLFHMAQIAWCCLTPERLEKTTLIMGAIARGCGAELVHGAPPDDGQPFAIWGQRLLSDAVVPKAHAARRPWWHVDNGYWHPARGGAVGYYRLTYRSMSPVVLPAASGRQIDVPMSPWRQRGRHVLLALPGLDYGHNLGLDMRAWCKTIPAVCRRATRRPIVVRPKTSPVPLAEHLHNAWVVVTHSSNVAVDAVLAGIPVIVAPTSPAAPVGNLSLSDIERPRMPDRSAWWRSLMGQQFTLAELADGSALPFLAAIAAQVDKGA